MDLQYLNELSYKIRGAIVQGPFFSWSWFYWKVYTLQALSYELSALNLSMQTQLGVPVNYNGMSLELGFRMDLLVQNEIISKQNRWKPYMMCIKNNYSLI
jgi:GxxExxY protein